MAISHFMTEEHKRCDTIFAEAEGAVCEKKWEEAINFWEMFSAQTEHHFRQEEEILFPSFEQNTGMSCGPTEVMRMEHSQMRGLFGQITVAIEAKNEERALGLMETFMILLQQHNAKEEQMLYRMCDNVLSSSSDAIVTTMKELL